MQKLYRFCIYVYGCFCCTTSHFTAVQIPLHPHLRMVTVVAAVIPTVITMEQKAQAVEVQVATIAVAAI